MRRRRPEEEGGVHLEDMQNTDEDESQSHLEMEQGHCRIQRAY